MKYFTINELTKSATAAKLGIANIPSTAEKANLEALIDNVLDPLRRAWGKPIVVNCGYRCEALNKAVKGEANSQHKRGQAADIEALSRDPEENKALFNLARALRLPFDQLINEFGYNWLHISYNNGGVQRGEVREAKTVGGKTVYPLVK